MDAVIGNILWPFVTIFAYLRFTVGVIVCIPPVCYHLLTGKKLSKFVDIWNLLSKCYLGSYVFSGIAAFIAPYSSSINPHVKSLQSCYSEITMPDYPWLRNPFGSLHAIALANLGEFASGLCMMSALQYHKNLKGIPVSIEVEFIKKARGTVTAKGAVLLEASTVVAF